MINCRPFMFLSKRGVLYAETKIHNLDTGEVRPANHTDDCNSDVEKDAYNECVSHGKVVIKDNILVEPIPKTIQK